MKRRSFERLVLTLVTLLLAACSGPVEPEPPGVGGGCAGVGPLAGIGPFRASKERLNARLHVDPRDVRWIWATDIETEASIGLRIPGGYGITDEPDAAALVDPTGRQIGRSGDLLVSGCHDIIQDAFVIDETDIQPRL